jgi:GNAT superfamily N-acetyltransferase
MSETWTITPAVAADGAAVADLLTRQLDEHGLPADRERVASAIAILLGAPRHGFLLVAREDGVTVGVAFVAMHWSLEHGGQACWLEELYVLPDRRGRGVGRDLLRAAAARARERGCLMMDLEVLANHARAGHLYAREGFRALPRERWVREL